MADPTDASLLSSYDSLSSSNTIEKIATSSWFWKNTSTTTNNISLTSFKTEIPITVAAMTETSVTQIKPTSSGLIFSSQVGFIKRK